MKKDYFSRLRIAARWQLEHSEAEDVLSDYQDLVHSRSEEDLMRDFGPPSQVIQLVRQSTPYNQWMVVFVILTALLPLSSPFQLKAMVPALLLAFVWFQLRGTRENGGQLPRGFFPAMTAQAVLFLFVWVLIYCSLNTEVLAWFVSLDYPFRVGPFFYRCLCVIRGGSFLLGLYGLISARLGDRRWRAVYIFALLSITLAGALIAVLSNMDISGALPNKWLLPELWNCLFITVIGLIGTGVGLC